MWEDEDVSEIMILSCSMTVTFMEDTGEGEILFYSQGIWVKLQQERSPFHYKNYHLQRLCCSRKCPFTEIFLALLIQEVSVPPLLAV